MGKENINIIFSFFIREIFYNHTLQNVGVWRSLASALPWGGRGRRFKSCHSDHVVFFL